MSQPHSKSSMHYTNSHQEIPCSEQASRMPGKPKGNTPTTSQISSNSDKGLDKPPLTPQPHQSPGTINPSQWTSTEQEPLEGIREVEKEGRAEETLPGQTMSEPKEGHRVHASIVGNKVTLLMTLHPGQSTLALGWPS